MNLSPRLLAISDFVEKKSVLSDIGTDHGYIPAHLIKNGVIDRAVLSDINEGPLENARTTFRNENIYEKGKFLLGGGLEKVDMEDIDNVIIAGMGGLMISQILENDFEKAKKADRLILQPMQNKIELRKYLLENGFEIIDESLAKEDRRIYEIIIAKYDGIKRSVENEIFLETGVVLPKKKDSLYDEFLEQKIEALKKVVDNLSEGSSEAAKEKHEIYTERLDMLIDVYEKYIKGMIDRVIKK